MTDTLRTRIAAVLYSRAMSRLAWHRSWDDLQSEVQQMWLEDADAVIAELDAGYILVPKSHTIATAVTGRRDCNLHPDAPHGFDRNASHSEDRYVCDCEGWVPPDPWEERAADERKDWADD